MKKFLTVLAVVAVVFSAAQMSQAKVLRAPDALAKGAMELSLILGHTPAQNNSTSTYSSYGIGFEYGTTDQLGIKGEVKMGSWGTSTHTDVSVGASYALMKDNGSTPGVSLQASAGKEVANSSGTVSNDTNIYTLVAVGKRMGKFYPFAGIGYNLASGTTSVSWLGANLATKYDFTEKLNGWISANYFFSYSNNSSNTYTLTGAVGYTL